MRARWVILVLALLGLCACGAFDDDTGQPFPTSTWPWICADGGPAPASGCVAATTCPDGGPGC